MSSKFPRGGGSRTFFSSKSKRSEIAFDSYESSYVELLCRANLGTLHLGRLRTIALETFKCINNIAPPYIRNLVNVKQFTYSLRY